MTAIERASQLAAYIQTINNAENRFAGGLSAERHITNVYPMHTQLTVGKDSCTVEVTRMHEIPGDVAVLIISRAVSEFGASRTGIKSTGGIYAHFIDA